MTNAEPLVSCLCVTEDRAEFLPWLFWAYQRQTWQARELVIVDSSSSPCSAPLPPGTRVIEAPHRTSVAAKRNLALENARGDAVAWFDDDDWQHPERLTALVAKLTAGAAAAGPTSAWFVDPRSKTCRAYTSRRVVFNGAVFWSEVARSAAFDTRAVRGSDTLWLRALGERYGGELAPSELHSFFWLVHEANLSNPRRSRRGSTPIAALEVELGDRAWGDTSDELEALCNRLESRPRTVAIEAGRRRAAYGIVPTWARGKSAG